MTYSTALLKMDALKYALKTKYKTEEEQKNIIKQIKSIATKADIEININEYLKYNPSEESLKITTKLP